MPPTLGRRDVSSISVTSRPLGMVAMPWGEAACLQAFLGGKRNPGDWAQWCYCWFSAQVRLKCYCSLWNAAGAGWLVPSNKVLWCNKNQHDMGNSTGGKGTGTDSSWQCGDEPCNSMAEHPPKQRGGCPSRGWQRASPLPC